MSSSSFQFANISNVAFIDEQYEQFKSDPQSVDADWQRFFAGVEFASGAGSSASGSGSTDTQRDHAKVEAFVHVYRRLGHLSANLSPIDEKPALSKDLSVETHGLKDVADSRTFYTVNLPSQEAMSLSDIKKLLEETYCRSIGADFREINDIDQVIWLQGQMEGCRNRPKFSAEEKKKLHAQLVTAEGFERFLQDRYLGQKRFSLEGTDSLIPMMHTVIDETAKAGAAEINIGMAHRGRLNVLTNIMGKSLELIFKDFEGKDFTPFNIDGDVKYHKGFASEVTTSHGHNMHLYLLPNPSHLEVVNPVVEGFARARQDLTSDTARKSVVPLLIHGDAAFIAQGSVAETLNLALLDSYTTGGTIHIIINNQIGFTANPSEARSCRYASDIAKLIRAPVFHVNADDPEACVWVSMLASQYRQKYGRDVVIDLIGYRRHGHNETDEPNFTQPLMYKKIKAHSTVLSQYETTLANEQVLTKDDAAAAMKAFRDRAQRAMEFVKGGGEVANPVIPKAYADISRYEKVSGEAFQKAAKTVVTTAQLKDLAASFCKIPGDFQANPKIIKLMESRQAMMQGEGAVDWGLAELLCFSSLAAESHPVRLSGQDCRRGTFSHRHAVWFDFEKGQTYEPLNHLNGKQARVDVINSPLSELAVMGFDFGYSVADPNALVIWEAQFGDFVNGAQIIIDQFLAASEAKWKQCSGLTLLLPHGYEGQGPEHSSARPERFLQLCGNLNIQVAIPTTPAQLFHLLRRQLKRAFRKPLVIMSPKSLLRHPKVVSKLAEFSEGQFQELVLDQTISKVKSVDTVVLCTGKIYYELEETRDKNADIKDSLPIIRVEQLYPFPEAQLSAALGQFPNLKNLVWAQEEPENMGAWTFMRPRLEAIAPKGVAISYSGRPSSGSTAEGSLKSHIQEQERIVLHALGLGSKLSLVSTKVKKG